MAAALRAYDGKGADADTIGEVMAIIIGAGDFEGWSWREVFARLADLIEPGDTSQGCRDTVACDREALLALADDLDVRALELLKVNSLDQSRQRRSARRAHTMDLMASCSRIREACGEVS